MLVVAFVITALAGVLLGIWLAARSASQAGVMNPVRFLAFTDMYKNRVIAAYAKELGTAIGLKYPDNPSLPVSRVVDFMAEYTVSVLEDRAPRRVTQHGE